MSSVDWATESLIAQLLVDDLEAALGSHKGKAAQGSPVPDGHLAVTEQLLVARSHLASLQDRSIARSLARALLRDQAQLDTFSSMNQGEEDDHLAALALSRGESFPAPTPSQCFLGGSPIHVPIDPEDDLDVSQDRSSSLRNFGRPAHKPAPKSVSEPAINLEDSPGDSDASLESDDSISTLLAACNIRQSVSKPVPKPVSRPSASSSSSTFTRTECVICGDSIRSSRQSFLAPCSHRYCRVCIVELVDAATRDEALFPLRCCHRNFDLASVGPFIAPSLFRRVCDKALEFGTPSSNRVYCTNATCSAFLGPASEPKGDIVCPKCSTIVCSACKNPAHPNTACTENAAILELRALARAQEWQTCPSCHAIVELNQGCFHITCRCRQGFCYLCAAPWKTCTCRQWDENRLLNAAERRVDVEFGAHVALERPAFHAERVRERVEELRVNHDCVVHHWAYRHGGGYCEGCNSHLPSFMMRCTNCQILACKRCSRNRF